MKNFLRCFASSSWAKIFLIFATLSFVVRTVFVIWEASEIDFSPLLLGKIFVVGFFFDLLALCYIALLPLLIYTFLPQKIFNSSKFQKANRFFFFLFLYIITFSFLAEITFFEEFQTRFNFIAVDYLIYTTEVIANIVESYPLPLLLSLILVIALSLFCFFAPKIVVKKEENFSLRLRKFLGFCAFLLLAFFAIDSSKLTKISANSYANEASANGIYQLFSAYRNNEIDFDLLYKTLDEKEALNTVRQKISAQEPHSKFLNDEDISRQIPAPKAGKETPYNVIFITMESFSADFMKSFGSEENISPNLDALAKESLFFTNLKATGTRTVRGLEALSLSVPPTPGNSIVRRPNNEKLFNIASPLKERGFEARFIYGGDGYFDNMNYFFEQNGFEIVDRKNFSREEISFENAWGVSDEDLFNKAIAKADESYAHGKMFFNFVMTTSNHRPFTYPDGKIDIAPKTGRNGAVKYSDYAVGKLVEKARTKKWFDNTIFVFVADHCAGSAGNTDVPLWRYQIPAIFYAPKIIRPQVFAKNISQIDIAPTLLGVMNLNYKSKFFGHDVLNNSAKIDEHSFVSTYTDIGYFKGGKLYLLKPKKQVKVFDVVLEKFGFDGSKETLTNDYSEDDLKAANAYYQAASHFFKNGKMKNFDAEQKN